MEIEKIKEKAKTIHKETVSIRRHIHANPELSFVEHKTSAFVQQQLTALGIPFQAPVAGTGIVALIKGRNPDSKTIALRSELDALPITETNTHEYVSKNTGVMHACGHDAHTAAMLGAGKILFDLKDEFEGTVKLIFQPGEEKLPGGASLMIKDGALENPKPVSILAQHVTNLFPAGKVGFRSGLYMASTDELYLTVTGKGGHAALPENYNNPLIITSAVLLALQNYFMNPSTKLIPPIPTVLAFGKITGKGATNVIPDMVTVDGTFRTMDENWRKKAHALIQQIASDTAASYKGKAEVRIEKGYPFLVNDEALTARSKQRATEYLGKENIIDLDIWMASEDFAYYSQTMPSCFYRLGIRNDARGIVSSVHTSTFDIDEDALLTGAGLMAWLAVCELEAVQ